MRSVKNPPRIESLILKCHFVVGEISRKIRVLELKKFKFKFNHTRQTPPYTTHTITLWAMYVPASVIRNKYHISRPTLVSWAEKNLARGRSLPGGKR